MTAIREAGDWTYQVSVAGVFGPALRAAFADLTVARASPSTVFRLRLPPGQGPAEIAAMLRAKGLVLISARQVTARKRREAESGARRPFARDAQSRARLVPCDGADTAHIHLEKEHVMATLVAIGYPDEITATAAEQEAEQLARDLIIEPDAIAVIRRDKEGKFHVTTSHHAVGVGATWGMFWGLLFGLLFFIPVFGMAVGAGLGALMGKVEKTGIDAEFQRQVRDMLTPGTSALFLVVERATPDKAVEALSKFGGTVLKSSLSKDAEKELQEALHGKTPAST